MPLFVLIMINFGFENCKIRYTVIVVVVVVVVVAAVVLQLVCLLFG